jgi:hypothetical protein
MDILEKGYPDKEHVLVFDNATTHLKQEEDALLAMKMPKFTPKLGKNWGVEVVELDEDCNIVHGADGKVLRTQIRMTNAKFADGTTQSLYWPDGHERVGIYKGMLSILKERGFTDMFKLKVQCKDFKCASDATCCCCRRILYTQTDFVDVPSKLETFCKCCGYRVIFLLKFHCEMNFIEQCWGFVKRLYHPYPASLKEIDLEHNVLTALESVPIIIMRQCNSRFSAPHLTPLTFFYSFATHAHWFIDAYAKGLQGKGAAWAAKKYHGHRVLPESILQDFDDAVKAGKA